MKTTNHTESRTQIQTADQYNAVIEAWRANQNLPTVGGWEDLDANETVAVMEALIGERWEQRAEIEDRIAAIAFFHLNLGTLETANSDELDFKEQAVWSIKAALLDAYDAGRAAAKGAR